MEKKKVLKIYVYEICELKEDPINIQLSIFAGDKKTATEIIEKFCEKKNFVFTYKFTKRKGYCRGQDITKLDVDNIVNAQLQVIKEMK